MVKFIDMIEELWNEIQNSYPDSIKKEPIVTKKTYKP
jgi:hypothetical protein